MRMVVVSRTCVLVSVFTVLVTLVMFMTLVLTSAAFLVESVGTVGADTGEELLGTSLVAGDELLA